MSKKILIVDDEPMIREVLREAFEMAGLEVAEAANGKEAFRMAVENEYDCVVSDVRMPGGDGLELSRNISQMMGRKPKVFLVTGYSEVSIDKAQDWGVVRVFEKPFDMKLLLKEVCEAAGAGPKSGDGPNQNTKF